MTSGPTANTSNDWRRRLMPAALLLVGIVATSVTTSALVSAADPARGDDPPAGRVLPAAALAAERPALAKRHADGRTAAVRARVRRLVDVVDRDAPPPRRIAIPAIGVSAPVVPLRREPDGTMQTPGRWEDAGWYEPGREPGERGPAVIAGHVDSTRGAAVFYRLRELRRGDRIRIRRADGSLVRFRVEGLERWPKSEFPTHRVFGRTRISTLRLVTCSGDFDRSTGHYVDNTIVYAARIPARRAGR